LLNKQPSTRFSSFPNGIQAWLLVDKLPAPVYDPTPSSSGAKVKKMTGFVESEEGKAFTVHISGPPAHGQEGFQARLYGDGN
jgi:hypothetical protein